MAKQRRTRKQKLETRKKAQQGGNIGFKVNVESLGLKGKTPKGANEIGKKYKSYLRTDLTKTIGLTMLALALELALWHYLFR